MGFATGFSLFSGLFTLMFLAVFGLIIYSIVRNVSQWHKNNNSPRLTVQAQVVSKRMDVTHHHSNTAMSGSTTRYYATFQVESGDRMELPLEGREYGLLAEGDRGRLTFQGTRYLEFQRD